MAQIGGFNANDVAPMEERTVLPPGEYVAWIVNSEMKPTSTGGEMLKLEFAVLDGEYKGSRLWTNLNLVNRNPQAVEIAQRELSSICRAVNVMNVDDSEQLHTVPLIVKVGVEVDNRDEEKYKQDRNDPTVRWRNTIKNYASHTATQQYQKPPVQQHMPGSSNRQPQQVQAPAQGFKPAAPTGATAGGAKPWAR